VILGVPLLNDAIGRLIEIFGEGVEMKLCECGYKPLSLSIFYALSVPLSQTTGFMSGSSKATKECPYCHKQFAV